jgi:protein-S-isoprenylcysteine O-methyltransferase Ste14
MITGSRVLFEVARGAYAALFVAVLPALLVLWAIRLDKVVPLPAYGSPLVGLAVACAGLAIASAGTMALWSYGRGLPMSPFPPGQLVTRGIFRLVSDPLYIGAVTISVGVSLAVRSAAGLWIVSPVLALSAVAFVIGFERDATRQRHGAVAIPLLRLPDLSAARPSVWDRISIYVLVILPWFVLYESIGYLGVPSDARPGYFAWDQQLRVIPWTEAIYAAVYPLVLFAPIVATRQSDLRRFAIRALWAMALIMPFYLLFPFVAPAKPVPGDGFWETLMGWERLLDRSSIRALPAYHVVWAGLCAALYSDVWPRIRRLRWGLTILVGVSCVTVGMHAVSDVVAGFAAVALIERGSTLWRWLRQGAEAVANSWGELLVGPVRFINHGVYNALAIALCIIVASALIGTEHLWWVTAMMLTGGATAGIWAQLIEGSSQFLRPYGYFGCAIGVLLSAIVAGAAGAHGWLLLAAVLTAGTFGQAIGRLRCLVQGCCHGHETSASLGIRYTHPRSRVVRLSTFGNVSIHPTPLYSILWTTFTGLVLLRLWSLEAPLQFIAGSYFVLIGLGRFVEEHFRGEPQTPVLAGLHSYQWFAMVFVIGGAVMTAFSSDAAPPVPGFDANALPIAFLAGILSYACSGVDFPRSNRRFSRLA